ncbi:MAG: UMP kinase [Firmicutes bacterium]|nr:UMP kinase [Bacillota bacterium]
MSRIILKISGEALKDINSNVSENKLKVILETIKLLKKDKHQIGIVVGGGNFFRGREHSDMNTVTADTIGMLGTVMNALYLKDYLEKNDFKVIVSTPFVFPDLINNFNDEILNQKYNEGNIIIFGGGIGKSGYSTDSGTILAREKLQSDLIIKMTNVDGVYNCDPKNNPKAYKFDSLTFDEVIKNKYQVMDEYAIIKCKESQTRILVINFNDYDKLNKYFNGEKIGTIIGE